MSRFRSKYLWGAAALIGIFLMGWAAGFAAGPRWEIEVNGRSSDLPIHIIKNMFFINLEDLARLPGWNVQVDLGSRKVSIETPAGLARIRRHEAAAANNQENHETTATPPVNQNIESSNTGNGPPDNVRMTVQAALGSLDDLQKSLADGSTAETVQKKLDDTSGIVRQAISLLWSLPKTRTLQADLEVALEDLQSQVSLFLAHDQAQDGVLPWTHPTAQNLFLKYPDLRPCHVTKGKTEGLDEACGKNMLSELEDEDVQDVQRDLNSY